MIDYVKAYDNVLSKEECEHIIKKFESNLTHQVRNYHENHHSFKQININHHIDVWGREFEVLFGTMQEYLKRYKSDLNIDDESWPNEMLYEQLRIKRYLPNTEDEFKFHVDSKDYLSARRFLAYFWYLNDVNEGGETVFQLNREVSPSIKVQPKTGKLLMFPPLWTHPHLALPPVSGPKYIVGGYLHYV